MPQLISVCMATYNANQYLREQLDSILSQRLDDGFELEIIVSDDSTDDVVLCMVDEYRDSRIKYHRHEQRRSFRRYNSLQCATQNFANAIRLSRGDIVFLCDQDDIWYPNRIMSMVKVLDESKKHFVSSSFHWMSAGKSFSQTIMRPLSLMDVLLHSGIYGFSCAFTREFANYIYPVPEIHQHDTYIGALAVKNHTAVFDERIMAAHRCYAEQTSNSGFSEPLWVKVLFRCKMIFYVVSRRKMQKSV